MAPTIEMMASGNYVESYESPVKPGDVLEVVGGANNGGIIVRIAKDKTSPEATERLATGSFVRATECDAGRLSYELVQGAGPAAGWVSLTAAGKELLAKVAQNTDADDEINMLPAKIGEDAIHWYGHRLIEAREAGRGDFLYDRKPFPLESTDSRDAEVDVQMIAGPKAQEPAAIEDDRTRRLLAKFSAGRGMKGCHHCRLPLGEYGYSHKKDHGKNLMHAECMAQVMLKARRAEEALRKQEEAELKQARREEYEIGWKASTIPSNALSAGRLGCAVVPQGMCCLVLEGENSIRVAPTFEPASSLNLEYLSVALQVRRSAGREPLFSLDPIEAAKDELVPLSSMQMKRFEPEWLAGTSVGEVMFQADYHLKELSMGEHQQPVMGMKSCFDYSKIEGFDKDWSAREWFVVRKAELHVSEDAVLVPYLKMGVEAREQLLTAAGLEDAPLTRPDHPLVKYAEAFTHNFDLIAERKSVVNQLREVAKASIIAKFMLESGIELSESWFQLGAPTSSVCCLEIPQLWNDRCFSKVCMENGEIVNTEKSNEAKVHSVYGGVDFGIDRFRLAAPSRIATSVVAGRAALGRPASTLMATSQAGLSMGPARQFTRLAAPLSARATLTAPTALLVPYLKMGVEAREQLMGAAGLEDAALTRPDHPLVKYAEAFTKNFDLIAERKSVVNQLRELAKASIVAKFMMESGVEFHESWFTLGEQRSTVCCLEVPQLWNDKCFSKIRMQDSEIVTAEKNKDAKVHSVYGGVDFGIDRFRLAAPSRIATSVVAGRAALGRPASTLMATSQAG
eukprot:CAMPEP_0183487470 /NCGR_PEP_ID=MMETSP0370-20130417/180455_1 /TAXON_ID=268820 /ORGANISM="Peridinium aciculiferum, Strain PAER-2" /LENGTH=794 /DNA_ID=CAMNT_0025680795 /DNA_START=69 /DNA_END=2451 /DNA_ORIENTATION=+